MHQIKLYLNIIFYIFVSLLGLINNLLYAANTENKESTIISNQTQDLSNKHDQFVTNINNSRIYFDKALSLVKNNKYKEAIELFTVAIQLDPKYVDAYIARASISQKIGLLQSALLDYTYALNLRPSAQIYYDRGIIALALKSYPNAIKDFSNAIALNPQFAGAYNQRGKVFLANNMLLEAKNDFIEAFNLNNNIIFALEKIGDINLKQGNLQEALKNFNLLIQIKSDYADAYFSRGQVYEELQMNEQALKDYNTGIELSSKKSNDNSIDPDNNKTFKANSI